MSNWTSATPTLNQAFSDAQTFGPWQTLYFMREPSNSNGQGINSGYVNAMRYPNPLTVPSVTAPVTGYCMTSFDAAIGLSAGSIVIAALEYQLGSLNLATGVFTSGSTMPTKTVRGTLLQTASLLPAVYAIGATGNAGINLTVTYTNQSGTAGQTANLSSLPTLASPTGTNQLFLLNNNLATGDTGVRSVTNMSFTGGGGSPTGTLIAIGLLPVGIAMTGNQGVNREVDILQIVHPIFKMEPGETLAFYEIGSGGTSEVIALINATPEQ